jgi:hypothetical protein
MVSMDMVVVDWLMRDRMGADSLFHLKIHSQYPLPKSSACA